MSKRYNATLKVLVTIEFDDDGEAELSDQATDALDSALGMGIEDCEILNVTDIVKGKYR